jgi:hypothetical protein
MTPSTDTLRNALLAEFTAIRSEITTLHSLQGQFMSISAALMGGFIAVAASTSGSNLMKEFASIGAIPFVVLGLLYADVTARILRAARFIQQELRPEIVNLAAVECLLWEAYLSKHYPGKRLMNCLDYLRWALFLIPAAFFTVFAFVEQQWWGAAVDVLLVVWCLSALIYVYYLRRKVVTP